MKLRTLMENYLECRGLTATFGLVPRNPAPLPDFLKGAKPDHDHLVTLLIGLLEDEVE